MRGLNLSGLRSNSVLQDATSLAIGQGIRLLLQAAYFVFLGRCLGPAQYGAFAALAAMAAILAPFVGLGCGQLFVKNVRSVGQEPRLCWGNGLFATAVTGVSFTLAVSVFAGLFIPGVPVRCVVEICGSDLVFARAIDLASLGFAATGLMKKTAVQNTIMSLLRLIGIAVLAVAARPVTIEAWAFVYMATSFVGGLFALQQGNATWGLPKISLPVLWADVREGCFFSISTSAQTIYNDIDKTMLAKMSSFSATGLYTAAYRVVDTSLVPVRALVTAAYPDFFRIGKDGLGATYDHAKRMIAKALAYGVCDFAFLMLFAPALPLILGPKYAGAAAAVRILSIIPAARCVHSFLADALAGANSMGVRTAIQIGIAGFNIALNLIVLPRWSWQGAAWTSVACDGLLALSLWIAIRMQLSVRKRAGGLIHAVE